MRILYFLLSITLLVSCNTSKKISSNEYNESKSTSRFDLQTLSSSFDSLCHNRNVELDSLSITFEHLADTFSNPFVVSSKLIPMRIKLKAHNIRVKDSAVAVNESTVHSLLKDSLQSNFVKNLSNNESIKKYSNSCILIITLILFLTVILIVYIVIRKNFRK